MDQQDATPSDEGADTLDRLERYLAAEEAPPQKAPEQDPKRGEAEDTEVEPSDDGPEQETGPQLTTADLAKVLGLDESAIILDDEGGIRLKTKIDGQEGAAKLTEMLKSYQLEGHVNKRSMELAAREKAMQEQQQQAEHQFKQRIDYAEGLANVAAKQLMGEYQSIDWNTLEQHDAGQAALLRQKFQEKQAQLRGVFHNIDQHRAQAKHQEAQRSQELLQKEATRLVELIPEWKDSATAVKEQAEIREWGRKQGFTQEELDSVNKASVVVAMRKAMRLDALQQSKPTIENKVRKAPVIVKPGQPNLDAKDQNLKNLKHAVVKSGGDRDAVAAYLLASGKA